MSDPFEYDEEDPHVDGLRNLQADSLVRAEALRQRQVSHEGQRLSHMVTGARARVTILAQPELLRQRTAHQKAACWRCGSKDVGYDFSRGRWSCMRDRRAGLSSAPRGPLPDQ